MTWFDSLRWQPRCWAPTLVFVAGVATTALIATELHRSERNQSEMQISNIADGFGALLQMHLAGCEEALRAASMVASADPHIDARQWQAVGRQVRVGECLRGIDDLPGCQRRLAARRALDVERRVASADEPGRAADPDRARECRPGTAGTIRSLAGSGPSYG